MAVLHLPDPRSLAEVRLGAERAAELLAVGAATPVDEAIAEVLAAPSAAVLGVTTRVDATV